jgi:hypothetical protein
MQKRIRSLSNYGRSNRSETWIERNRQPRLRFEKGSRQRDEDHRLVDTSWLMSDLASDRRYTFTKEEYDAFQKKAS